MATPKAAKTLIFKDLHERLEVKLDKPGIFFFGLTTEGHLCAEGDEDILCVKLFKITYQRNGGCLLSPLNRDLTCFVDSTKKLSAEMNLSNGTVIEIAEKKIRFVDGSVPRGRRHLPHTPGQSRETEPPPKPARTIAQNGGITTNHQKLDKNLVHSTYTGEADSEDSEEDADDKKWIAESFIMLDLPTNQRNEMKNFDTPEQIGVLAASHFTKQLRLFTDAVVTGNLIDNIFKLFMETVEDCRDSYMTYLQAVSRALSKMPSKSQSSPMHKPAVQLATDLLRNCFDPISNVILILNVLRTFSHFENNLHTMVRHQTSTAVIGSMTAFNRRAEVQQYGLDILSKVALYAPKLGEKPPLKEVGVEQVLRGVKQHPDNVDIGRAACRVLATLSSTLFTLLNQWIDSDTIATQEQFESLERIEQLLEFVFKEGIPVAQQVVDTFSKDLGVKMEFRRFVSVYAKHQHFRLKKEKWTSQGEKQFTTSLKSTLTSTIGCLSLNTVNSLSCNEKPPFTTAKQNGSQDKETVTDKPDGKTLDQSQDFSHQGILKKSRSYECLRTSEKKLNFDASTVGGSDSDSTTSDSDSSDLEIHGPLQPEMPLEVNMEDDFSFHLVQHLVKKTVKRQRSFLKHGEYLDTSSSDSDESDKEFLESVNYSAQTKSTDKNIINNSKDENCTTLSGIVDKHSDTETHTEKGEKGNNRLNSGNDDKSPSNIYDVSEADVDKVLRTSKCDSAMPGVQNQFESSASQEKGIRTLQETKIPDENKGGSGKMAGRNLKPKENEVTVTRQVEDVVQSQDDELFMGKLVLTQIIAHMITMIYQGEDSKVLQIIDQSVRLLLKTTEADPYIVQFARNQYSENTTLMDLEPELVIRMIDAVRYRKVAMSLLHSTILSLTRILSSKELHPSSIKVAMVFYETLFSNPYLQGPLKDETFLKEFRQCYQNARTHIATPNFVV